MKKLSILAFLFLAVFTFGQHLKPIPQTIKNFHNAHANFTNYSLFNRVENAQKQALYAKSASELSVLSLNSQALNSIYTNKPETLKISIPFKNSFVEIELFKKDILANGFLVTDEKSKNQNVKTGVYYRGIVANDYNSIVAISFFENNVMGVISQSNETGNYVLGKAKNNLDYVIYQDDSLLGNNPFTCGIDELPASMKTQSTFIPSPEENNTMTTNCVRVYYELCKNVFDNFGSVQAATEFITGIHNNIGTLYSNDNVQTAISEVMVWTNQDPYTGTFEENLPLFTSTRLFFNGDLAHLVKFPSETSVAYLNSLCTTYHHAFSGINASYGEVPTYSWTIMAMTHEMGHALGSPHTHACYWNGNNTMIDGCGPTAGHPDDGANCDTGPLPYDAKGTIMSYCHLVPGIGINFTNGFGPQPAQLIRETVDSKLCLGTDCTTSCAPSISDIIITNTTESSFNFTIQDIANNTDYIYRVYPVGGTTSAWTTTDTNTGSASSLSAATYYILEVATPCPSAENPTYIFKKIVLTDGNFCNNYTFYDTGGNTGDYSNNENFVKTFYPSESGGTVTINFEYIDVEEDYDFFYVYNGDSTDSPLFSNGNAITGNHSNLSFTSTDSSGAITVKFLSDPGYTERGWKATIVCNGALGIDGSQANAFNIYPNPTKEFINITAKEKIISIELFDASGKLIVVKKDINNTSAKQNLSHLPAATYFIKVKTANKTYTDKIIKK